MNSMGRTLWAAVCCLIVIVTAGCAALSPLETKQATLEERVKQYMQAQVDGKWDEAYSFLDSASRGRVSRESYLKQPRSLSFKGFAIEEITVLPSGDQATAKVKIDIAFMGFVFPRAPQTQTWVKEQGGWFIKQPEQSRANPFMPGIKQK